MLRIGWFSSGRGPGSQALFRAACAAVRGGLPVQIAYLFCNREPGEHAPADALFAIAAACDVPLVTLSSGRFRRESGGAVARVGQPLPAWRFDYDRAVLERLKPFGAEIAVLAGYLLIAPLLCHELTLLNLHPAEPGGPAGLWQDVIWQLIERRATRSGVTIFRATAELDAGPTLSFCRYDLTGAEMVPLWQKIDGCNIAALRRQGEELPLFREIRRRGAMREAPLLLRTLEALGEGRLHAGANGSIDATGRPLPPLDLTREVDRSLAPDL